MDLLQHRRGRVATLVIDRAARANAIDLATAQALSHAFDALDADDDVWAIVLTGAGERVFCAGMDLRAVEAGQAAAINGVPGGFAGLVRRELSKPVIAAVNGAALGGGFEIALACDLVVAARNARFGLPEVTRGLIAASGGLVRLPHRLPPALALELILCGDPIDAERAAALGLVNRVVDENHALDAALELADRIVANGPLAVRASKRLALRSLVAGEPAAWGLNDELAAAVGASADAAEGAAAAAERRPPRWTGS
ncbi:MAG TPA: crotonase/enoyl-CoA hydratase family protein [Solirubrobacter sp.]|nr:crotonase/enoyl-CoA hydratase family protein [Solirubrobacter sp.]